jgi:threonylcarbamoyladenosine tRNA methylthiotransferase MtaB
MGSFHVEHFGCRAARADGEAIADRLRAAGCCAEPPLAAGLLIVNTCSVTAEADRAARAFIRRAHRRNPAARIVVTGCYAQRAPQEAAALEGVTAVIGNSHKALAPEILLALAQGGNGAGFVSLGSLLTAAPSQEHAPIWADDLFAHSFLPEAQLHPGAQTRPNLKIQEGCGNRCSFCVIPQTRGSSRSLAADAVLQQAQGFVAAGGNELVLSGINLGRWGRDLPDRSDHAPRTLAALLRRLFAETALPRLRLSSIEPMDWDAELLAVLAEFAAPSIESPRLARHLHLPLQSGSDAVLRRMYRRYRPWHYRQKVQALLAAAGPDLTLGADVMAGFPGETEGEFEETLELIRSLPFGYLHLFPFSPRPGTPAWALHAAKPVKPRIVEERMDRLRALAEEKSRAHRSRFIGREVQAITLHTPPDLAARGLTAALTENFLPIELDAPLPANRLLRARVRALNAEGVLAAAAI